MKPGISNLMALPLLVVSPKGSEAGAGDRIHPLFPGQVVQFRVLPATAAGEVRIRIDRHVLSASVPRPISEGATGKAVVKRTGPPLVLQLTELSAPTPRERLRIPVLTGKTPLRDGPFPPSALERWNEALLRQYSPDLQALSPERLKEGILLMRFLSGAMAIGMTGGERSISALLGARRKHGGNGVDGPRSGPESGVDATATEREPEAPNRNVFQREDIPFWFFLPTPGEKAPIVFPGHRRQESGEREASWGIFLRLPDLGAVSVRFQPADAGWRIAFSVEHEGLHQAISDGAVELEGRLREKGFPLRDVTVRRIPKGQIEAEVTARMSRDLGIPLLERRA